VSSEPEAPRSWLERLSQALLGEPKTRDELLEVLREAEQRHLLNAEALSIMEGAMMMSEMRVADVMIPKTQMIAVNRDDDLQTLLPLVVESQHSRFPVLGEDKDSVDGILLAKDLLAFALKQEEQTRFNLRDILRPAVFVPESKRLDALLKDFKSKHNHMAIVVDEYGGISGLVTIEDVIEQIVGDIEDESDQADDEAFIKKFDETQFHIKAITPIDIFNEYFDLEWSDQDFDTVGGLVLRAFGHLPKRGEAVTIDGFRFKVLHADKRRIHLLQMKKLPTE